MKKLIACILTLALAVGMMAPTFAVTEAAAQDIPIITIPGTSNTHILNAEGETVVPDSFDLGAFLKDKEAMRPLLTEFAKATVTDRWDTYSDLLLEAISPIWAPAVYNNDGEPQHGDHTTWTWSENTLPKKTSGFREGDYYFRYDWRRDPLYTAQELDAYIDAILRVTGAQKVALVGRCYGACVAAAYLEKYGCGKVDHTIMYMPMATGVQTAEAVFTGDIMLKANNVNLYLDYWLNYDRPVEDDDLTLLLSSLVTLLYYSGGMHLTTFALQKLVERFKDHILPRILRASYGTYPGYWAMIGQDAYERAKQYVFGGVETDYAGLIEKTDRYHETVLDPLYGLLDEKQAQGMKLTVIAKYGFPTYPFFEDSDYLTDSSNSLTRQSFGATTSTMNTVLPECYLSAQREAGLERYLSADKKVDASTCRYPDQTWFFKDVKHLEMDGTISALMTLVTKQTDQLTVADDERFPQFMHKDENGQIVPLTENDPSDQKWKRKNPIKAYLNFWRAVLRLLKNAFGKQTADD